MQAIRLRRKLDSDQLHLPELAPLIGKMIEMIVWEDAPSGVVPGTAGGSAIVERRRGWDASGAVAQWVRAADS